MSGSIVLGIGFTVGVAVGWFFGEWSGWRDAAQTFAAREKYWAHKMSRMARR